MARPAWICRTCLSQRLSRQPRTPTTPTRRFISSDSRYFQVSEEVRQAISENRPVVALETTVYTHGFPPPENAALAARLESLVRTHGAVPATIGILNGVAHVGLAADQLIHLVSQAGQPSTLKISRRDLGFALGSRDAHGRRYNGGTTIAGTMILAHMAGIRIFATGGLGGVHRGAETTMDISADLTELGRTPVAVISAGCKAFLDLPKTLEYLETQGVSVATFADGRTSDKVDFPAFWTRESGVPSPFTLRDELDAARVVHAHFALGLQSGLHFANPIPEEHSLSLEVMEAAIYEAIKYANMSGVVGAAATPYILKKIREVTGDASVPANRALLEANAVRGAKVAVELSRIEKAGDVDAESRKVLDGRDLDGTDERVSRSAYHPVHPAKPTVTSSSKDSVQSIALQDKSDVFVAGSLAIDLSCDYLAQPGVNATIQPNLHTSNPARISQSLGGVGSNVARAAHLMGANVRLCSAVGDDLGGKAAMEALHGAQMSTTGIKTLPTESEVRTAQYVAVNDTQKDLMLAMADMSILETSNPTASQTLDSTFDTFWLPQFQHSRPSHFVIDGNWSPSHLNRWLTAGAALRAHTTFEPVSTVKATRPFHLPSSSQLTTFPRPSINLTTPNASELTAMHAAARETGHFDRADWWAVIDALGIPSTGARTQLTLATSRALVDAGIPQQAIQLLPFMPCICTKLGAQGVLLTQILPAGDARLTSAEAAPYILSRCANGTEDEIGVGGVYMRLLPAVEEVPVEDVVSVNGVGDTFLGALVAGLVKRRKEGKEERVEDLVDLAQRAAVLTLKSREAVSGGLGTLRILL